MSRERETRLARLLVLAHAPRAVERQKCNSPLAQKRASPSQLHSSAICSNVPSSTAAIVITPCRMIAGHGHTSPSIPGAQTQRGRTPSCAIANVMRGFVSMALGSKIPTSRDSDQSRPSASRRSFPALRASPRKPEWSSQPIRRAERTSHINNVHRKIQRYNSSNSEQQRFRKVPARLTNFAGNVVRRLPAAIRKNHRYQRRAENASTSRRKLAGQVTDASLDEALPEIEEETMRHSKRS